MSDPDERRALRLELERTRAAYAAALAASIRYEKRCEVTVQREAKADPATLERVREAVNFWATWTQLDTEFSSARLAEEIARRLANMPSAKTLQNVYLPAIREDCPHAVQVGREWMWFRNARALASRDTVQTPLKG